MRVQNETFERKSIYFERELLQYYLIFTAICGRCIHFICVQHSNRCSDFLNASSFRIIKQQQQKKRRKSHFSLEQMGIRTKKKDGHRKSSINFN